MRLPSKFLQVHAGEIERCFHRLIFRIIPKEPLGGVKADIASVEAATITVVTVRCVKDHGTIRVEAFSPADLAVADEWEKRHRDTTLEEFAWFPAFERAEA